MTGMVDGLLNGIGAYFTGLVPDWTWALMPYWPWLGAALLLGGAYRLAGAPGLAAVAAAMGFVAGRRSVHEPIETDLPPQDRAPSPPKPRPRTLQDLFGTRQ